VKTRVLVAAASAAAILAYLWVAVHRVGYPYELDWMEGGSVELAARVATGHSLYAAPSLGFVGWTYTPLYYILSAGVSALTGIGFVPLRLVSLLASMATMGLLGWVVVRETGDRVAGLLAAGLFAAAFRISGAWFDTGRVDSLFVALTLGALAFGCRARSGRGGVGLGALCFLAFFTKQSALVAVAPALVLVAVRRPRAGVAALLTLLALVVLSTLILDGLTADWYRYYVFDELSHQPWAHQVWLSFWREDILGQEWPLALLVVAAAALAGRPGGWRRAAESGAAYWGAAGVGLLASAWASRLHTGGYLNVLMPAYAAMALAGGLAYARLTHERTRRRFTPVAAGAAVVAQLILLAYPIGAEIPSPANRAAGAQLIARLRMLRGPVLVLRHPWYASELGEGAFAQEEAIGDVLRSTDRRGAQALRASLRGALNADHVQAVVLDGAFDAPLLGHELARDFRLQPRPVTPLRLYPLTDVRSAPTLLYTRIRAGSQSSGAAAR
jgi:hypothetical protein